MSRISAKKRLKVYLLSVKGVSPFIFANVVGIANYNLTLKRILTEADSKEGHPIRAQLGKRLNFKMLSSIDYIHYSYGSGDPNK